MNKYLNLLDKIIHKRKYALIEKNKLTEVEWILCLNTLDKEDEIYKKGEGWIKISNLKIKPFTCLKSIRFNEDIDPLQLKSPYIKIKLNKWCPLSKLATVIDIEDKLQKLSEDIKKCDNSDIKTNMLYLENELKRERAFEISRGWWDDIDIPQNEYPSFYKHLLQIAEKINREDFGKYRLWGYPNAYGILYSNGYIKY